MKTNKEPPGRALPAGPNPGTDPGAGPGTDPGVAPDPGPLTPTAVHLEELGVLIDEVTAIDRAMAVQAAARVVAIEAARVCSERELGGSAFGPALTRRSLVAELACALRIPASTASGLLESSRALVHDLPDTLAALAAGQIGYRQAIILANETAGLPAEAARRLEQEALPSAGRLTAAQFERKTKKLRERIDPGSITARHLRSVAFRAVRFDPARDGMAWLSAYLPASDALGVYNQVTDRAIKLQGPEEPRTLTQLRADVLRGLLLDPACTTRCTETGCTESGCADLGCTAKAGAAGADPLSGLRPNLLVTVPMLTLLGVTEEPGNLDGYGPIDPDTARALAAKCPSAVRILTHPETGAVLSVGRDRYTIPASLRTMLQVRDGTSRHPGCSRAASRSDIDHGLDWAFGGRTDHNNLAHLCPASHALKHEAGWKVSQATDGTGTLTWTTPTGHTYVTEPETLIGTAISAELRQEVVGEENSGAA
ncbi:HNH endonuclease signature motif containing protein [Cryobacterium tagatosivorans]|uniref:HNH endonuclease n=1 Tax=Cryobacterium tagatosivorans TaxID=1259199 RepID=A0A4R8UJB1_9MICO|nr:HNH endonuclease signature motif containing protein [Cryobacterium tagatosivorans]TFB55630.1 HNH endonuclease [Cryobacterium tagatosivorans]